MIRWGRVAVTVSVVTWAAGGASALLHRAGEPEFAVFFACTAVVGVIGSIMCFAALGETSSRDDAWIARVNEQKAKVATLEKERDEWMERYILLEGKAEGADYTRKLEALRRQKS